MLEAIRIRKCGFPVRRAFDSFTRIYKNLFDQNKIKGKSAKEKTKEFIELLYFKKI